MIRERERPVDILFLDVTLPGAPSRDVLREAKSLRPEIAVVVTSAYGPEMASQSLQADIAFFLRKPYRLRDMVETIRRTPKARAAPASYSF